jgi:hypothetical protein
MRTVFSKIGLDVEFQFIGNPIVFKKTSDFEATIVCSPYDNFTFGNTVSILEGRFSTDDLIDISDSYKLQANKLLQDAISNGDFDWMD